MSGSFNRWRGTLYKARQELEVEKDARETSTITRDTLNMTDKTENSDGEM